ncbi:hypothetical protein JKF63_03754 [Porcisia hertigi]|uniref:Uncharacterized protein n=1 Tax=Porcisia hertigi TaxID=2761500 RepID=A0A836I6A5_9TRYP|nr:hypothetical protein JKF63_03754 [Porcisia hertigi]
MNNGGGAINKELAHSLYRRSLKLVSLVERPPSPRIVQAQWAEFVPSQIWISSGEEPRHILRRSFAVPYTSAAVANAFAFLKEARKSLFSIWVLAEWQRLVGQQHWDLYDGMVLMSAALYGGGVGCGSCHSLEGCIKDYHVCFRSYVHNIAKSVQERMEVRSLDAGRVEDLNKFVQLLREASALERREAKPEDFSLISLLQNRGASEYVLNILIVLVLRVFDVHSTLVGADLSFRWVRVMPRNNSLTIFASWSHGAMRRKEAERLIRTADTQWYRCVPWDALQRKSIVCALLRRQLGCLPRPLDTRSERIRSACKDQIMFLLS